MLFVFLALFNIAFSQTVKFTPDGSIYNQDLAITTTVYGRTMTVDPGSQQRIIDIAGKANLQTGALQNTVTLSSVFQAEATDDGIAAFDYKTSQVSYVSNGAFGGAVFTADMNTLTALPPESFYLLPVAYLGYDGTTGSRVISGENTPGKNFLILEKPNFGLVTLYPVPTNLPLTADDCYDGKTNNYYVIYGSSLMTWNVVQNVTSSFTLGCMPPDSYTTGSIFLNPLDSNSLLSVILGANEVYSLVNINLSGKNCTVVGPFGSLPPTPRIVVATEIGYMSGYIAISVTSDVYNAVILYDQTLKVVTQVHTPDLLEDIFIQETST
jgi:hypothetical protein